MKFLLFFVFLSFFATASDIEKRDTLKKASIEVTNLNFLNVRSLYQGSNLLTSFFFNFKNKNSLGLSSGIFYFTTRDPYLEHKKMKYIYFPVFLSFKKGFKKGFIKFDLGTNILSFFDSDYYLLDKNKQTFYNKTFWPKYNATNYISSLEKRNKHWIIFSPSLNFKIINKLSFSIASTFYIGNKTLFSYLNIGLTYKIF